jgi:hypothetical protein
MEAKYTTNIESALSKGPKKITLTYLKKLCKFMRDKKMGYHTFKYYPLSMPKGKNYCIEESTGFVYELKRIKTPIKMEEL